MLARDFNQLNFKKTFLLQVILQQKINLLYLSNQNNFS